MAIWPFGRKNKRHTIQFDEPSPPPQHQPQQLPPDEPRQPPLTRQHSKRQKNRHSQPVSPDAAATAMISSSLHDVVATASHPSLPRPSRTALSDHSRPQNNRLQKHKSPSHSHPFHDLYASQSNLQPAMSRSTSVKGKRTDTNNNNNNSNNNGSSHPNHPNHPTSNGHAVLKKRLSQRKLNKIVREQEIRLMASCPIDIPRRAGEHHLAAKRGPPRARSRRAERHRSDTSLSVRDSAASSLSDISESNTYKVNALAAFTPRPLIRYVEAPRLPTSRSHNASAASTRQEKLPALTVSEENLTRRRVDRLADDLDAGGLRELLERDRRRRELKDIKDQERLQRKLERSAERQRREEQDPQEESATAAPVPEAQPSDALDASRGDDASQEPEMVDAEPPGQLPGSWLRDPSKEPPRSTRESLESVHVIGNIDDSSIREPPKLGQRPSFAPSSQDMGISRTTLSPAHSQSPSRHGVGSPTSSLIYGMARESMSDASRTMDSERRLSDHSGRRVNTFSSLFRRGSSRLKRSYRERFQDQPSDLSNASHPSRESFSRIPTQSSGPTPSIPPRPFPPSTSNVKRSQSKFTEHFGDEPLSPPDSRLQSPDIAEEEEPRGIPIGTAYPIPGSADDLPSQSRHYRSWISDAVDESDNVPLSQSLASIDSEGSWMSGHFLRRISQRRHPNHPVRHSTGQFEQGPDEVSPPADELPSFVRFSSMTNDEERTSGDAMDEPESRPDLSRLPDEDPAETWHTEVGRRPVLVNPTIRPKSTEGMLKNIQSLSPISAEEEFSPIEEHSAELDYATDEEQHAS